MSSVPEAALYTHRPWSPTFPLLCTLPPTGSLYPTSMRIGEDGCLVVNFKTEAQFHGLFVLSHPGKARASLTATAQATGQVFPSPCTYRWASSRA